MLINIDRHLLEEEEEDAFLHLIPVPVRIVKQWGKKKERGERENKKNNNNGTKEEPNLFTGCYNILLKMLEWEGGRYIEMEINDLLTNVQLSYHCLLSKFLTHEKMEPQLSWPVRTLEIKVNWVEK